jgi:hypothetical protein
MGNRKMSGTGKRDCLGDLAGSVSVVAVTGTKMPWLLKKRLFELLLSSMICDTGFAPCRGTASRNKG